MIFIDMDGVVADFDSGIRAMYGKRMEELNNREMDEFWNTRCASERFFAGLGSHMCGFNLVGAIKGLGLEFSFLTSTGGGVMHSNIAKQKLDWLQSQGLGDAAVAFCTGTKSKGGFASRDAILLDDRQSVVDEFRERGGEARLFELGKWRDCYEAAKEFVARKTEDERVAKDAFQRISNYTLGADDV